MLAARRTHALLRCARHLSAAPRPNPDATAAFRRLMRARAALFRDDAYALRESRLKLREEFGAQAGVSDAAQVAELLRGADEVEELLRENVVQGRLNERDNYAFKVKGANEDDVPDHVVLQVARSDFLSRKIVSNERDEQKGAVDVDAVVETTVVHQSDPEMAGDGANLA